MRQVIIHYHIFKNAGTTIDSIFKRQFRNAYASIDGNTPNGTLDREHLLNYALEHPEVKAISSHQCRLPVPITSTINFHPILFLRHPIDRVGSVYLFERGQPKNGASINVKMAKENDLEGYVKWRLAENHGAVIKNFQTIFLSGREKDMRTAKATKADLEIALERIEGLDFFGIVELFDQSIVQMKIYLSKNFNKINTSYNIKNKSQGRKESLTDRLGELKKILSSNLYDELIEKNSLDLELYNTALALFNNKNILHRKLN